MYVSQKKLAEVIIEAKIQGTITPELYLILVEMVAGVHGRWKMASPDDVLQDVCVAMLRHLGKLDPTKNLFSYLTTTIRNEHTANYRSQEQVERLNRRVWEDRRIVSGKRKSKRNDDRCD